MALQKAGLAGDEIDLLTLLIEKWDEEHNSFQEVDPIPNITLFNWQIKNETERFSQPIRSPAGLCF